jgi:hypothetical protein
MRFIKQNIKNIIGWKTNRKIVVFTIDDYGNVRMSSRQALNSLKKSGIRLDMFDRLDALETRQDLEQILEVVSKVRDKNGSHPVLTLFSVPCNINFERMADDNYRAYYYELLPETFAKLSSKDPGSYQGAWDLWLEGMKNGIFVPQFHGREHFNLKVFEEKLQQRDLVLLNSLRNYSNIRIGDTGYPTISYTAAFKFWDIAENERFEHIIEDGLNAFENVFGKRSSYFVAPGTGEHQMLHPHLVKNGIRYLDSPLIKKEHQGFGKHKYIFNYTGRRSKSGIVYMVRNVVFEPAQNNNTDWVNYTIKQIESAFKWKRPAIISSHRVNFSGHIDPHNRKLGVAALQKLLIKVKDKWPDVEFMSADKLGELITHE